MIKNIIKNLLDRFNLTLQRTNEVWNPDHQFQLILDHFNIDLVLDVGANTGQFSAKIRNTGYQGLIASFEPLTQAHNKLIKHSQKDPKWIVHPRCAIGEQNGTIEINISENSYSSSILPILQSHISAANKSAYIDNETTPIYKLDTLASDYLSKSLKPFLKIDTQGYEWMVLNGAEKTLPKLKGVLCELSLVPLYEGQRLWQDLIQRLEDRGFTLWAIQKGFTDPKNGRTLQLDVIFVRL